LSKPSATGVSWSLHNGGEDADHYFLVLDRCSNTSGILPVKYLICSIVRMMVLPAVIPLEYLYLLSQVPPGITLVSGYRSEYTIVKVKSGTFPMHALKPFSAPVDMTSQLKLVMCPLSAPERIDLDEPERQAEIRGPIWQFPNGNGAKLIAGIQMDLDEVDLHVAFLELVEREFTGGMIVEDLRRITICRGLVQTPAAIRQPVLVT
jgi:hypothetical protein